MIMKSGSSRLAVIGAGLVLAAGVIAGCGGDDSSELTKDEFITQADQICADFNAQATADQEEFRALLNQGDFAAAADNFDQTAEANDEALSEIEALQPPAEDQETIDRWIEIGEEQLDLADEFSVALRNEDAQAINALGADVERLTNESNQIADDYGMVDCGSAGDTA
jgi:hypothetical protein